MNNAGWRIQTFSAIRYGGPLYRKTLVTFGYLQPTGDIITKLKQQIDTDIETLYQVIAEQPGRGHTVCMTAIEL